MARVVKPGGRVGIHDLCWKEGATDDLKRNLANLEGEYPETLSGWSKLFREAGLTEIVTIDKSDVMPEWMKESRKQLGVIGQAVLTLKILQQWGLTGVRRIWKSEHVFSNTSLGYGLVAGSKR